MMMHFSVRRSAAWLLAASLVMILLPGVVLAHSELVTSDPAQGAVVPSPFTGPIVLTFSEHLADGSKADLIGPDGATVASATVNAAARTMSFTLSAALDPGAYEIRWVSIADDLDVQRQPVVKFTVAPAPSAPPTAAVTASPAPAATTAPVTPVPSAAPTPAPSGGGDTSGSAGDVVLPIVLALIILAAGAFYLLARRTRPADPT